MSLNFTHYQPARIHFGAGVLNQLGDVVERHGQSVLVLGPHMIPVLEPLYQRVEQLLSQKGIRYVTYYAIEANPSTTTVEAALALAREAKVEVVLAVGGGSTLDTGKMVGFLYGVNDLNWAELFATYDYPFTLYPSTSTKKLPVVAVNTTSGTGSQLTQASIITDHVSHQKLALYHPDNYPKEVITDPELMMSLPLKMTAATAFDAFTHAFESYCGDRLSPFTKHLSERAITLILNALPQVLKDNSYAGREQLALADTYAGMCLSNGGAQLPHPLSEVIGSTLTHLAHGQCLAMIYPYFLDVYADKFQAQCAFLARTLEPSLNQTDDQQAAHQAGRLMRIFQKNNHLEFHASLEGVDATLAETFITCPVWSHLPFAPRHEIEHLLRLMFKEEHTS